MSLREIFLLTGTDKATAHDYGPAYETLFDAEERNEVRDVLEIGVLKGASLLAWEQWFPAAHVVGLDVVECSNVTNFDGRIEFIQTDATEWDAQDRMFDLVVDDGSHRYNDITSAFDRLWPHVRSGGWYVVEDCDQSEAFANEMGDRFAALTWNAALEPFVEMRGWPKLIAIRHA